MWVCVRCGKEFHYEGPCPDCGEASVPTGPDTEGLAGRVLDERYTLLEPLGAGGMGTVFRAKRRDLDAFFAVKILRNDLIPDTDILPRFFAEARHASQLKHPHTVRVFDFNATPDGLIYLAMELVDGVLISHLTLPLPVRRAVEIIRQVSGAIAEAHERGLVHRDLKPDNIMISEVDGRDFARVLDFGIATLEATTGVTADGTMVGTPEYISPEQASGLRVDRRADVYGLGLVLYEMVTGRPPFKGSRMVVAYKHINEAPPAPSTYADIPEALDRLILDCLAKNPEDRPPSMAVLRNRLDACVSSSWDGVSDPTPEGSAAVPPDREPPIAPTAEKPPAAATPHEPEGLEDGVVATFLPNRKRWFAAATIFVVTAIAAWAFLSREDTLQEPTEPAPSAAVDEDPVTDSDESLETDESELPVVSAEGSGRGFDVGVGPSAEPSDGMGQPHPENPADASVPEVIAAPPQTDEMPEQDEGTAARPRARRQREEPQDSALLIEPADEIDESESDVDPRAVIRSRTQDLLNRRP